MYTVLETELSAEERAHLSMMLERHEAAFYQAMEQLVATVKVVRDKLGETRAGEMPLINPISDASRLRSRLAPNDERDPEEIRLKEMLQELKDAEEAVSSANPKLQSAIAHIRAELDMQDAEPKDSMNATPVKLEITQRLQRFRPRP